MPAIKNHYDICLLTYQSKITIIELLRKITCWMEEIPIKRQNSISHNLFQPHRFGIWHLNLWKLDDLAIDKYGRILQFRHRSILSKMFFTWYGLLNAILIWIIHSIISAPTVTSGCLQFTNVLAAQDITFNKYFQHPMVRKR